ncbi:NADH dehydrogenase [ubiquinone] 1 beta subcomplex subunit 10 [Venturia canescens]|uniref:NADH dehydrogenase [ubiquinone] 1 beta subcomplex subunit 10 n=1 Tax=Venturia canescens TaxID=32260 RepID=UPI001C9CC2AC|nr:NADH dehydrogenase [ubiquinone] 1 beta subcomplex subunit 10 [Venturia canescens]
MDPSKNFVEAFLSAMYNFIDKPVTLFREKIVEPNQQHYPWYHQKFRRVPTVDECYSDDLVCIYEADQQYARDRLRDDEIISILRNRAEMCLMYNNPDRDMCLDLKEAYEVAAANWFSKHGDQGPKPNSRAVYMKQKHRMIWERRHGPIGSGMKTEE